MSGPGLIVLVGLMGTGKSAVARRLAGGTATLLDTDRIVENNAGTSVREVFSRDGEEAFRLLEEAAVRECLSHEGRAVVAAAGGVVTRAANRAALTEARTSGRAWVVWLHTDTDELVRRVAKGGHRPLLDADPEGTLGRLAQERSPLYASVADATIDTTGRSLDEVAGDVMAGYEAVHGTWGGNDV